MRKDSEGGTGSGDVNNKVTFLFIRDEERKRYSRSYQARKWLANYESIYAEARRAWKEKLLEEASLWKILFDAYAESRLQCRRGHAVTAENTVDAQTAIYVVSRISGGGEEMAAGVEGRLLLSEQTGSRISGSLDAQKIPTVLILNSGGRAELTADILEEQKIYLCLSEYFSQLGQRGGLALASVLLGKVTPRAKLTATWARKVYEDYPCAREYSYLNGKLEEKKSTRKEFIQDIVILILLV